MSRILRRAAVVFSSVALICFWSCERHQPEELGSHGDHAKGGHDHGKGADHGNSGGLANEHGHDHSKPESHSDGHDQGHHHSAGEKHDRSLSSPAIPPVAGTPAQFFPAGTPSAPAASPAGSPR